MDEKEALKASQEEIKKESKKIADSLTRILLLGGPNFVDSLLESFQKANDSVKDQLKLNMDVQFENDGEEE